MDVMIVVDFVITILLVVSLLLSWHIVDLREKYDSLRNKVITYLKAEGHEACWTNRKALADEIGDGVLAFPYLPPKPEFLEKCNQYYDFLEKGKNGNGGCCESYRSE